MRSRVLDFYSNLYSPPPPTPSAGLSEEELFRHVPTLEGDAVPRLTAPITIQDISSALSSLPRGKASGIDGLPVEFYYLYQDLLTQPLLEVYRDLQVNPHYSPAFAESVISLVPKKGDLFSLSNWRPISISNADYKIYAKLLALRLRRATPTIVHPSQTYALPDRTIYDSLAVLRDLVSLANSLGEPLAVVNIDFNKAFDRVAHDYMFRALQRFGFPPPFIQSLRVLYSDAFFRVRFNNTVTDAIPFRRGIRQGCPLSGFLFVLALEPLLCLFRHRIGARLGPTHHAVLNCTFADDCNAFLRHDGDFEILKSCLARYSDASGAVVNFEKSFTLWCGSWKTRADAPISIPSRRDGGLFLGAYLGNSGSFEARNWPDLLLRLRKVLGRWYRHRHLCSLEGRVLVANTLAASVLWHRLKILQPPATFNAEAQTILTDFVWDSIHWVPLTTLVRPREAGGLGLVDVAAKVKAFRVAEALSLANGTGSTMPRSVTAASILRQSEPSFSSLNDILLHRPPRAIANGYYASVYAAWFSSGPSYFASAVTADTIVALPVFDSPFLATPSGEALASATHQAFLRTGRLLLRDYLDPHSRQWIPAHVFFAGLRPSRSQILALRGIHAAAVRSFPGAFDSCGLSRTFRFGSSTSHALFYEFSSAGGVSRLCLGDIVHTRDLYRALIASLRPPLRPTSIAPLTPREARVVWNVGRLSPFTTRLENAVQWRALHGALASPSRLFHIVPDFPSPHCPFCPAYGTFEHMYSSCPIAADLIAALLHWVASVTGHQHTPSQAFYLVRSPGNHFFCNLVFVTLKCVLRDRYRALSTLTCNGHNVAFSVRWLVNRCKTRVLARHRSRRAYAELSSDEELFDAEWAVPQLNSQMTI